MIDIPEKYFSHRTRTEFLHLLKLKVLKLPKRLM